VNKLIKYLPLLLAEGYLTLTLLLFLFGPFNWPRVDSFLLSSFLILYQIALALGYYIGAYGSIRKRVGVDVNYWFKASLLAGIILIVPYTYVYTGSYPWDILHGVPDQAQAFAEYYQRLSSERTPERILVMVARTIFSPLLVALIPLFFWTKKLQIGWRILFVLYILLYFSFSLLRGTDKESADFLLCFAVGLFSRIAAEYLIQKSGWHRKKNIWPIALLLSVALWVSYTTFMDRKLARLGGDEQVCIQQADVCADLSRGIMPYLDERNQFGVSMATLYLSIGYYGMGLALEEQFESTAGLGHSLFVSNGLAHLDGIGSFFNRTYTAKVSDKGWDALVYWVTTYTWFANDVGFIGVVALMILIGFIFSRTWHDVIIRRDFPAIVLFPQIVLMIFYLPAFNVTMQNVDNYIAFVFWLVFWMMGLHFNHCPSCKKIQSSVAI
jgi:hypothetical protein